MTAQPGVPTIRRMDFPFDDADIPAHWWDGDRMLTRNADALHMLFPAGERFFMRSVRAFVPQIKDPELLARVRGFMGQEAMHGREHNRAFSLLERDGIEYESFLDAYENRWLKRLEGWDPALRATAHLLEAQAEMALGNPAAALKAIASARSEGAKVGHKSMDAQADALRVELGLEAGPKPESAP